jgi:hypothetical protein
LLHEELTRSATHDEAREVMHQDLDCTSALIGCVKGDGAPGPGAMNPSYMRSRN